MLTNGRHRLPRQIAEGPVVLRANPAVAATRHGLKRSATGGSAVRQSDRADGRRHIRAALQGRAAGPGRWLAITTVTGVAGLLIAACSSGSPAPSTPAARQSAAKASAAAAAAELHISPGGGHNVNPSQGITVTAASGKIQTVSATSGH